MHSFAEISCYFVTWVAAGNERSNWTIIRSSSRIGEESSNVLAGNLVDVMVKSKSMDLTAFLKDTTDKEEDKLEKLIDSKSTASPGPKKVRAMMENVRRLWQETQGREEKNILTSKAAVSIKPRKESTKMGKNQVIATEEALVTLLACDNSGLTVGRGIVHRFTTTLHGKPLPEDCQVVTVVEAKLEKYRLPYPNFNNDPPQQFAWRCKRHSNTMAI
jgi:hypothetical protein